MYDKDIESTNESPGRIYDKAGNHKDCEKDQVVKRDTVIPNTPSIVMTHSYNENESDGKKATVYDNDTWVNANIKTAVYMTDARYYPFRGPSATDSGTVQSGINRYQISSDNKNWSDYEYKYSRDSLYALFSDGTYNRYVRAIDNAGNISEVRTLTIKIDKTAPSCTPIIKNQSNQKLKYGSIQHVKVTTYAGCSDSTSQCTSSEVQGKTYDPNVIGSNLSTKETNYIKKDTIQIKDNAGNKRNCSVEAYTTPLCHDHTFIHRGNRDPYGQKYWCALSFTQGGAVSNSTLHTSFCLAFNKPEFKSTYGTPTYFAICEGGDDAHQCKANCNSDITDCPDRGTLVDAFQYLIDNNLSNQSQWTKKNPTNYMQRFEKIHSSGNPNDWPDYPFTGRMMSKKGSVYNICDIDYGADGNTVKQRFA